MEEMKFEKIDDFIGLAVPNIKKHNELSRSKKVFEIDAEKCIACGKCVRACNDSAYQAISMLANNKATIDKAKCDGCGLCASICPVKCISII
jgi:dihydropyrimidine dehydrogenase (NAD+) subunit PreA